MTNPVDGDYQLILLAEQHIETLYDWSTTEKHFAYYTCRPLGGCQSYDEYADNQLKRIAEGKERVYVLVKKDVCNQPLGKIKLFDWNTRNHSAEFGYYLPENNRGNGLGSMMASKFLQTSFGDAALQLNKVYATTFSHNIPSICLLKKLGFQLDGRMREHYWINVQKYDQLVYSLLKNEWLV